MFKAIVYESNTGFTKSYAEILSEKTGMPAYSAKDAKAKVSKGSEIFYMGWLCAGSVKGFNKAAKNYDIKALAAVGMRLHTEDAVNDTIERHNIKAAKVFYLQGGFDMKKLHGINKLGMKMIRSVIAKGLDADKNEEEAKMLDMLYNGGSCVSEDNLSEIITFINNLKR